MDHDGKARIVNSPLELLRELIGVGEMGASLEQLLLLVKGTQSDLVNDATVLSSRYASLLKRERRGLLRDEDVRVELTRLSSAVLALVDDLEKRIAPASLPVPSPAMGTLTWVPETREKIFGASQLRHVAWLRKGIELSRSVGRVVTPEGTGTGFLVNDGLVMTNHHVIGDAKTARGSRFELNYEDDAPAKLAARCVYAFEPHLIAFSAELDFSLLQLRPQPDLPPPRDWAWLSRSTAELQVGDHVSVIQHPHGGAKQMAVTNNRVVNVYEHRVQYMTDTLPGSSGSPVFDNDWQVVALHRAGGRMQANARGDWLFANEGVMMGFIWAEVDRAR